jgi:hypothetical protein
MSTLYYIGLDIHKRVISYCIKAIDGRLIGQGKIEADRKSLDEWVKGLPCPWVGELTALTWVLEIGDPGRFASIRQAVSYCGLCSAQRESAGKKQRGPISKKRNKHLQTMLIEAAKLAPHWNEHLAIVHERELKKGNRNRATLAVARKLVAYMLAVDKKQADFKLPAAMQAA